MRLLVETVDGGYVLDLDAGELEESDVEIEPQRVETGLPRVVATAAAGATVAAVVEARPPLLVSHDAGRTWRESGRGLPPGFAVAVREHDPDTIVFAGRNRLYVSRDGGVFWQPVEVELPDILAIDVD
jgi:photosystem II stability/assembly factor-like uncharacterized protein